MQHKLDELNTRLAKMLADLEVDPVRSGEICHDAEFDAQGLRVHEAKLKRVAETVKVSEQYRKNIETAAKLELQSGKYIHEKEFEEIVNIFYTVVEESILKYSDPQEQLKAIREGLGEFV